MTFLQILASDAISSLQPKSEEDTASEDKHYEQMSQIVDGDISVNRLKFEPGTLSIFAGNECLHRVTECKGDKNRLVAVLCYGTRPGMKNSKEVQKMFWGRTAEDEIETRNHKS